MMHCIAAEDTDSTHTVLIPRIKYVHQNEHFLQTAKDDFLSKQILL